jgi:acylphosphatase
MSGRGGEPPVAARRILVSGLVQGVGFRFSTVRAAERLGVGGWARNLADGRVEVHAQGEPAAVAALVDWLREGPPGAEVARLDEEPAAAEPGLEGFFVRR